MKLIIPCVMFLGLYSCAGLSGSSVSVGYRGYTASVGYTQPAPLPPQQGLKK